MFMTNAHVSESVMLRLYKEEREEETDVRRSSQHHGATFLSARLMMLVFYNPLLNKRQPLLNSRKTYL